MCHLWSGDMAGLCGDKTGFLLAFSTLSLDIILDHHLLSPTLSSSSSCHVVIDTGSFRASTSRSVL